MHMQVAGSVLPNGIRLRSKFMAVISCAIRFPSEINWTIGFT